MSNTLNTNIPSLNAQNHLRTHSQSLSGSLEKLASGLRINRASDDASGLAISDKMRGQIRGVDRAMANAQQGMSLIQTADGALNETTAILERMRELAVQAANDTYTPSDRLHIQSEIDQLRQEVDRVAHSTEFNTKKLLSGDSAARWSVSDPGSLEAIIRSRVESGTYQLDVHAKAGRNEVLRSNIMTLRDGAFAGDIIEGEDGVEIDGSDNDAGIAGIYAAEGVRTGNLEERTYRINVASHDVDGGTIEGNSAISITAANVGFMGVYQQDGSSWSISAGGGQDATTANQQTNIISFDGIGDGRHGYLELRFESDMAVTAGASASEVASVRFIDVKTGEAGAWASVDLDSGVLALENTAQTFDGENVFGAGAELSITGNFKQGDKALFSINAAVAAADVGSMSIGAGAIKIDERFYNDTGAASVQDYRGAYYIDTQSSGIQNMQITDGNKQITYHLAQLDAATGSVGIGSITLDMEANADGTETDDTVLAEIRGTGGLASSYTQLQDIDAFMTPDNLSAFLAPQQVTLYGNSQHTSFTLSGSDSLSQVERKFTRAITEGLDMGTGMSSVDNRSADYIAKGSAVGNEAGVEGTFVLRSLLTGTDGRIAMAAEDAVVGGFNLHTIQNPEENHYQVQVSEARSGRAVGFGEVNGSMLRDLIPGMDILLKGNPGIDVSFDPQRARYDFSSQNGPNSYNLHVVDNSPTFQVGANPGQGINMPIGRMDSRALELDNLLVLDRDLSNEAIARIDRAIGMVSAERGKMGAIANRMDHTINSLAVAFESMQSAESRIRDVNVAREMSDFVRHKMLTESSQAMLGQANMLPKGVMQLLNIG
ncbi:flagellin [Desulfurispira natronophila]|uniref:Flagellin n=1 Tax=Desulfurispira natronophila TaxID=682562 RepID=A0A7W8DH23_9BACT|nr:flagellin [Desulfurispira natronophila]MBB5022126.1 flagellin [Desulfurispira natronophila]